MITLILVMLRTRRGQAVTLAVLSLLAVGAAVAVPAYLAAVDAAVVRGEVAAAEAGERTVSLNATVDSGEGLGRVQFADVGNTLLDLPGFTHVYSARFPAVGIEPGPREASWITYRQHVCAHVTVVAGRCLIGSGEVLLGEQSARRLRLRAGDEVTVTYAVSNPDPEGRAPAYTADGAPVRMVVVGVYRVPAPRDEYWGGHDYFALDAFGRAAEPVFTDAATFELMHPAMSNVSFDATADASVFDPAGGAALRDRLARLKDDTARLGAGFGVTTRIPDLVDRIDRSRDLARQTVPVGAVPLVLLAYLALYLAVDYGAEGRRTELAVVALRGTRWWHRWTLALGESVAAIAAGAVAGYAAGQLAIGGFVAWRFPGLGLPLLDAGALWPAVTAALGAVLVAALAQRRHLLSPVSDLLRRVRRRAPGFPVGEVVLGALAAAAVGQLFATGGRLSGVGMLAPALSILTLAAAGARLLGPAAAAVGRAALARGRVGTALAALHLGRRPAAHRILLLLVTATAVLGYAVSGADVAGQDRDLAARITTGAPRVVTVVPVSRQQLLYAVRSADPDGRFAMAVAHVPGGAPGEPPKLAVDSARLPSVVEWLPEYGDLDANRIAQVLHPPARPPIVVTGQEITIDIDVSGARAEEPVRLFAVLASLTGRGTTSAAAGVLADGPYTVRVRTSVCADGCRLVALRLAPDRQTATGITVGVTLRGLGGTSSTPGVTSPAPGGASPVPGPEPGGASPAPGAGPGGASPAPGAGPGGASPVPGAGLADATRWRATGGSVTATGAGLRFTLSPDLAGGGWLQPVDTPYPLPVVGTGGPPDGGRLTGLDERQVQVFTAGRAAALPRLGTAGTLVDLEYADRAATDGGTALRPEVWLGADAPDDVLARLARTGLVVTGDVSIATARDRLDAQGPAIGLWFHLLAGALALLLGAVGLSMIVAVDRPARAADRAALRAQGVDGPAVRLANRWTYPALVLTAATLGLVTALAAWRLTGWALPMFGEDLPPLPLPRWPGPVAVPATWLAGVTLLLAVAVRVGGTAPAPRPAPR